MIHGTGDHIKNQSAKIKMTYQNAKVYFVIPAKVGIQEKKWIPESSPRMTQDCFPF